MVVDRETGAVRMGSADTEPRVVPWTTESTGAAIPWPDPDAPFAGEPGSAPPDGAGVDAAPAEPGRLAGVLAAVDAGVERLRGRLGAGLRRVAAWAFAPKRAHWTALGLLFAAVVAPLFTQRDAVFIAGLNGDMIATIWFYDLVGRSLPSLPTELVAFNFPDPVPVAQEFPSLVDAAIAGPLLRVQGWVAGWGSVQALLLLLNAGGVVALARAAGARGAGLFLAGALGLLCRQLWFDLANGRMNAAWPGFGLMSAACLLHLMADGHTPRVRAALAAGAAALGALVAHIYPPHLVLLAPLVLALGVGPAWRHPRRLLWVLGAVAAALAVSAGTLQRIAATRSGRFCGDVGCSDVFHTLPLERLAMWRPAPTGLNETGLFFTSWLVLPLVLRHARRRVLVPAVLLLGPLLAVGVGPCPQLLGEAVPALRSLEGLSGVWCVLEGLTDYARAATVAALSAAVLSGLALGALRSARARWAVALVVTAVSVALLLPGYGDASKWARPNPSPVAAFLAGAAPGAIAELPYDMAGQYQSALDAPNRRRRNPLKPMEEAPSSDPALRWLDDLGRGSAAAPEAPTAAALSAAGLRWIFFDPTRCPQFGVRCPPDWRERLEAVLGSPQPQPLGGDVWVWEVVP